MANFMNSGMSWFIIILTLTTIKIFKPDDTVLADSGDGAVLNPSNGRGGGIRGKIERINARRQEREQARQARKEVCYDDVGCFAVPRKISPLKKSPESPENVGTTFLLFTRKNGNIINHAETLNIDDAQIIASGSQQSILDSDFDLQRPVKIIIHGFRGSGKDKGALSGVAAFLNLSDVNVITVDWERGAAGPSYSQAVANTELVGRQTGLLLVDIITFGVRPTDIHMVGFSLGAHVAACAAHTLLTRLLVKVGRITGLDPASPIFRSKLLLEPERKLDKNDAEFVDVIHTDGSPVWTDGFGLLQPLGHVDFFPNGGREQPGCSDGRASVVVSHFEGSPDVDIACSHIRAWRLFVESLSQRPGGCQFMAYPCHAGLPAFQQGNCYSSLQKCAGEIGPYAQSCGMMGINADRSRGRGALYLVTRDSSPYCGEQLRATVMVSEKTRNTRGILHMVLSHGNSSTNFRIHCEYRFLDVVQGGRRMWGLAAANYGTLEPGMNPMMQATLGYQSLSFQAVTTTTPDAEQNDETPVSPKIYLDQVSIVDSHGNSWNYCGKDTLLEDKNLTYIEEATITLTMSACSP